MQRTLLNSTCRGLMGSAVLHYISGVRGCAHDGKAVGRSGVESQRAFIGGPPRMLVAPPRIASGDM